MKASHLTPRWLIRQATTTTTMPTPSACATSWATTWTTTPPPTPTRKAPPPRPSTRRSSHGRRMGCPSTAPTATQTPPMPPAGCAAWSQASHCGMAQMALPPSPFARCCRFGPSVSRVKPRCPVRSTDRPSAPLMDSVITLKTSTTAATWDKRRPQAPQWPTLTSTSKTCATV